MTYRVLVLGGYGQFGRRIVEGLAGDAGLDVIVAGRDRVRAEALCDALRQSTGAGLSAEAVDIDRAFDAALARLRPDLVIHTAGPFQGQSYDVARATLACGAHYVDLADGRAFVEGFDALDAMATSHGRWAITGASSVPGLSGAVIEAHVGRFATLETVSVGISPGNRTERGLATTRAILGYVGRPFAMLQDGAWREVHGWQSLRRVRIDGVGVRWFARCEVPDLGVLPRRYPQLRTCDFRAGLELRRMHFGLWLASWAVRAGLVRRLPLHAERLLAISEHWLTQGSDTGVMYVDMAGRGHDGRPLQLRWSIIARDGDGPHIPATAAVVLARKLARGALPGSGARACLDVFTLDEFAAALAPYAIETSTRVIPANAGIQVD
jgi:saccharopine dehydrogenase-like NADP-dependent oxidoreductase